MIRRKHSRLVAVAGTLLSVAFAGAMMPGVANAAVSDPIDPTASMATTSWGTNRIDLFAKGTDGTLKHKVYNGRWSAWESLGGAITSGPAAVSWGNGRIDVVARSTSGSVVHRTYKDGGWGAWASLGGAATGEPAISSWGANRLDVFVRGGGNAIYHRAWNGSVWSSSWANLGGVLSSSPTAVSWGSNRIDVFARGGSGNSLYQKYWAGKWSAWINLGGALTSGPAATSGSSGFIDVHARVAGNAISHKSYGYGQWGGWQNLGGTFQTKPAVIDWSGGHIAVFARGTDAILKHRTWNGFFGWEPTWTNRPDAIPSMPVTAYTPTVALQASPPVTGALIGPLEYSYVDNIGRLVSGHQPDPANVGSVQWTVVAGNEAFTGPPSLIEQPDKKLQITGQHTSGDLWARAQTAAGGSTWTGWVNQGGAMAYPATAAKQTDGSVLLFSVDSTGTLWYLKQSTVVGSYQIWTPVAGATGLIGLPTSVQVRDGLQVFARNTTGEILTATLFPAGTASAWTNLGGGGHTGTPSVVIYPGFRMRVFATVGDGTVVTKAQDSALAWPSAWSTVGTQLAAGSPAAVLSPLSGKTEIVVRGFDGNVYSTGETTQASGLWRDWVPVLQGVDVAATDPTVLSYHDGSGPRWAFLFRNADQQSRMYTVDSGLSLAATAITEGAPTFTANNLPAPPV